MIITNSRFIEIIYFYLIVSKIFLVATQMYFEQYWL